MSNFAVEVIWLDAIENWVYFVLFVAFKNKNNVNNNINIQRPVTAA